MNKFLKTLLRILGYVIAFFGGVIFISGIATFFIMLFAEDAEWMERIFTSFFALLFTLGAGVIFWGRVQAG